MVNYTLKKYEEMTDREKCERAVDVLRLHRSNRSADDVVRYVVYLERKVSEMSELSVLASKLSTSIDKCLQIESSKQK